MSFRDPIHYFLYAAFCIVSIVTETDWHFAGPNIALNKSASQSPGTLIDSGSSSKGYYANLAVDGNEDSVFSKGSCSHTTGSHYNNRSDHIAQWTVDLGGQYYVSGIIIVNREDLKERLKGFTIYGFSIKQTLSYDGWCKIYDDQPNQMFRKDTIQITFDGLKAFSKIAIKLPKHQGNPDAGVSYLTLCEVKVYAVNCEYIDIMNGMMEPKQQLYEVNAQARIVCDKGFEPEIQIITCNNYRKWSYIRPCIRVVCPYPGKPMNGIYLNDNSQNHEVYHRSPLPYESVITVKCDLGYRNESPEKRKCLFDGTWSGEKPVCTKVQCSYPDFITNGEYQLQNGSIYESGLSYYNTSIQVKCKTGYVINGDKERTCNANQRWSGETKCSLVTCPLPRMPAGGFYGIKASNGLFIPYFKTLLNHSIEIHTLCPRGFFLNSSSSIRRCLETGLMSGEQGKCDLVTCGQPQEIEGGFHNYTQEISAGEAPYNTIVTTVCDENFELVNTENRKRRCTEGGVWDKEPASCAQGTATPKTLTSAVIGGISGALLLLVIMVLGLVVYLVRRRKKNLKDQEELMTYTNLRMTQNGPSNADYTELNVMELEKDKKPAERENAVYCNTSIELK